MKCLLEPRNNPPLNECSQSFAESQEVTFPPTHLLNRDPLTHCPSSLEPKILSSFNIFCTDLLQDVSNDLDAAVTIEFGLVIWEAPNTANWGQTQNSCRQLSGRREENCPVSQGLHCNLASALQAWLSHCLWKMPNEVPRSGRKTVLFSHVLNVLVNTSLLEKS